MARLGLGLGSVSDSDSGFGLGIRTRGRTRGRTRIRGLGQTRTRTRTRLGLVERMVARCRCPVAEIAERPHDIDRGQGPHARQAGTHWRGGGRVSPLCLARQRRCQSARARRATLARIALEPANLASCAMRPASYDWCDGLARRGRLGKAPGRARQDRSSRRCSRDGVSAGEGHSRMALTLRGVEPATATSCAARAARPERRWDARSPLLRDRLDRPARAGRHHRALGSAGDVGLHGHSEQIAG